MLGKINKLETFGSVDGPGVRFVVFTQGCPMRCLFCHNPETWALSSPESFEISAEDLLKKALRYKNYWGAIGGITVSGGEPLMQMEFLSEFFERAKAEGVHTCIDTSGVNFTLNEPYFSKFKKLMAVTDLLLVDIKTIDPELHKKITGHKNDNILQMFSYLNVIQKPIWIRHVLVSGLNDNEQLLRKTKKFIQTLSNVERVEVLPYHSLALAKYDKLNLEYPLKNTLSPTKEELEFAKEILERN